MKEDFISFTMGLQSRICKILEDLDGKARFKEDRWQREEGGSGTSRVIAHGNVFEKAGVNTSAVHGELPEAMASTFGVKESRFFASGISLVIHPLNPMVPTVHANFRYFELYDAEGQLRDQWFGGGTDLTPCYIFTEDARDFHSILKLACDRFSPAWYPKYKQQCDEYFVNRHRNQETRGIGGIFYDYVRPDKQFPEQILLEFSQAAGQAFIDAYFPIVEKRKELPYSEDQVFWQEIRRGRYVEFNLIHDRGTLFGLKTHGRIESILMSLPPRARWEYDYHPQPCSREAELVQYLKPRDWVNEPV